jgi:hypothetical protein
VLLVVHLLTILLVLGIPFWLWLVLYVLAEHTTISLKALIPWMTALTTVVLASAIADRILFHRFSSVLTAWCPGFATVLLWLNRKFGVRARSEGYWPKPPIKFD